MRNYRQTVGVEINIFADAPALATGAALQFITCASLAIARADRFAVAISGGSTPILFFAELAGAYSAMLDWQKIHIFWVDERCVPPTDAASNYRMAKEQLLDHVSIPAANIHRMLGEEQASAAARIYEAELRDFFVLPSGAWPRFDLVVLGVGEDGHTASLFPATAALHETEDMVSGNFVPKLNAERITLTFPTINAAACVLVIASGANKSAVIRDVFDTPPHVDMLPMQGVCPREGELLWLLDAAAAAGLNDMAS